MYKVTLVQVGKTKDSYLQEGISEFEKRISRFADLETITIPEGKFLIEGMMERERKEETIRIKQAVNGKEGVLVYLDIFGKPVSSEDFAVTLENYLYEGIPMIFLIGGAYGIDEEVLDGMIKMRISLSKMTFTHQLVRLLFLEQLYRGFSIIKGTGYHH
ncbi:MAG: 23S rRNA (pseudouridine(1915)-N(3))-methyltransferase RlmH [Candidatus Gracilibacteria bacterium]